MNLGEIATLLFFIPYGVLVGASFSSPLAGVLSYLILSFGSLFCWKRRGGKWWCLVMVGAASFLIPWLLSVVIF